MSFKYKGILWNKHKKQYDAILWIGIAMMIAAFVLFHLFFNPTITLETLIIRSSSLVAITLLHIILVIAL